jgi:hypothetical protein
MEMDPHTFQQIIRRIEQQMRCPQCGTKVPLDFASVKLAGDEFMLLQLKCESCSAFIVLHVAMADQKTDADVPNSVRMLNASSSLSLSEDDMKTLRKALAKNNGSFKAMFDGMKEEK